MSPPARFYLDEDVAYPLTGLLRQNGHDAVYVRDLGTKARKDAYHVLEAFKDQRIIVTCNASDFRLLHDAWRRWGTPAGTPKHHGILCLTQRKPQDMARIIEDFLSSGLPIENECYFFDKFGRWNHDPYTP